MSVPKTLQDKVNAERDKYCRVLYHVYGKPAFKNLLDCEAYPSKSANFISGAEHMYSLMQSMTEESFDEEACNEAAEEIADDTWLKDFQRGARWQHSRNFAKIKALENQVAELESEIQKYYNEETLRLVTAHERETGDEK